MARKTVGVERSKPEPNDQTNGVPHGDDEPTHANGPPGEGERWLRPVLENSSEIVSIVDPDGTLRYASPAWKRVLGYDPNEVIGTNVLDHVHPEDLPHVLEETEKALSEGGITTNKAEYRFLHADGSWRWMKSVGTYLLDDPSVRGVVVQTRDVTERKEAEERLRFQAQLLSAVGEAVIALDVEGKVAYWNRAAEEMYGWSAEEALGRRFREMAVPEDLRGQAEEIMAEVRKGKTCSGEFEFLRRDGTRFPVEVTDTPVFGEDGDLVGVISVFKGVTERKETEEALRDSEAEVFGILESITDAFFALDHGWRFTYVNSRAEDLFSNAREDLLGERIWEDPTFYPHYLRAVTEGVTVTFEGYYPPLKKWYSVRAYPSGSGLSVYFQDVTERKGAEEALKESEEHHRRQSRELSLLHRVRTALAQELDAPSVLRAVVEAIAETYGYTQVSAYLLEGEELVLQHQVGYREVIECIPLTQGVCGRVVRNGKSVLVEDVSTDSDFLGAIERITSEICVPFFDEEEAVGLLNVESTGGVKLTQHDLDLMEAVGEHVGVAVSRARLHARVRRSEGRFRALTQNSSGLVTLLGADSTVRYQSPAVERMLGYSPEELLGKSAFDHVHPDDLQRVEMAFAEGLKDPGRRPSVEYRFRHRDGSWRWLESVGTNLLGEPAVGDYVINSRDVTERKRAEGRLREAEERYRTLVERIPAITYIQQIGRNSETVYVSPQVMDVVGYTPEECIVSPELWINILHPDDRERVLDEDRRTNETGDPFVMEYRQLAKDGHLVWIRDEATLVRDEEGKPSYWLGVQIDITERKRTEQALGDAEERYRTLVEQIPAVTYIDPVDYPDTSLYTSPQIEQMLGYTPQEWHNEKLWPKRLHPDDRERVLAADERFEKEGGGEPFREEYRLLAKDGSVVWVREEAVLVRDEEGAPLYWQGVLYDLTERKVLEERLEHRALHDPLTDLPNRQLFLDRLGQALRRTRRQGNRVAVLFMDLDEFKLVNDSLGHEVGDLLLTVVAQRLGRCLRPEDTLARFGGDEFVVLIEAVDDPAEAVHVTERITEELREPFTLEDRELYVNASIGVSLGDARTHRTEGLLREADTAMYRAKDEGGGFRVFDPAMYERAVGRLELENDLRRAIERDEFVLYYQPIVRLEDGRAWGMEALVRWEHPERGLLDPDEFVPVAEESGLVVPMGELVLEEACRRAVEWQGEFPRTPALAVSVNLSGRQLRRPDLHEVIGRALTESGLPASSLGLDITETVYISALDANTAALDQLKALGVRVSLDDFGSGYSSLSYLKRLPADILKIDRSFTKGLGVEVEDTAIVQTIVDLAHIMGMEVVGEGVEIEAQETLLKEMGCDFAQGYYVAKPLPPEEVPGFLAE